MSGSPEELLRSALEKVIFFECRVASLDNELDAARSNAARAREEAGAARRRETELETLLAQSRGEQSSAVAHNAELMERVRLLEAERERFLSGMVERARVAGAPAEEGEAPGSEDDLAGFISELRAEIEELRAWKSAAIVSGVKMDPIPPPPARAGGGSGRGAVPLPAMASSFGDAGRFGVSREEARALPSFSTRSERVLYEASLDDLGAADPGRRRRAADGLRVLASRGAAPLVAAALGRERDAEVKVALLGALGALAESGAADLALR
ncbi:MAG TPA: PBS lyase, partial [Anaeromyxobacteraceae bacterium]